ncbi:MAG: oxidoreductase [Thermoproteota archaeon]|nr:MAG: oxidoreductase [Candidatus Korarchaeota archaeon]
MNKYKAILIDLDRCVGCYACEVACRKENNLDGEAWIRVHEVGPEIVDGKLTMDFIISITEECTLCENRLKNGLEPFCVSVCPTKALIYCNSHDLLKSIKNSRIQVAKVKSNTVKE